MSHFRISDDIEDHPHFYGLSDRAFRVWVYAGAWCQRHLTDGVIPRQIAISLRRSNAATIDELVGATLLQPVGDTGQELHLSGYLKHNDSRAKVDERRAKIAERQARYRQARNAVCNAVTNAPLPKRYMTATSPHLTSVDLKNRSTQTVTPAAFDAFWAAYPFKLAKGAARKAYTSALKATTADVILAALERQRAHLLRDNGAWKLHPATWLNAERWADEVANPAEPAPSWRDECAREHHGTCHSPEWHQTLMAAPAEYVQRKVAEALERAAKVGA